MVILRRRGVRPSPLWLLLGCLATGLPRPAMTESLSLADAMARGRERGPGIEPAWHRARTAAAGVAQIRGLRLPSLRLEETWIRTDSPADAFGLLLNQERFSFAQFIAGDPNDPAALETARTRLEVGLPLFTGGELPARLHQAEQMRDASLALHARARDLGAFEAARAWLDLAEGLEALTATRAAEETARAHLVRIQDLLSQGMALRSDLLATEVALAEVRERRSEIARKIGLAQARLAFLLGENTGASYELEELPDPPPLPGQLEIWLDRLQARSDLRARELQVEAARAGLRAERSRRWPRVGLAVQRDLYDDRPFGQHGDSTTLAIRAEWMLFDGGVRRAQEAQAAAQLAAGETELETWREQLRLEARSLWAQLEDARARLETARGAWAAAAEARRLLTDRFEAGLERSAAVLDAAAAEAQARLRVVSARSQAWHARLAFLVAVGVEPEMALQGNPTDPGSVPTPTEDAS